MGHVAIESSSGGTAEDVKLAISGFFHTMASASCVKLVTSVIYLTLAYESYL
ncbi:hypothetical protein D3C87_2004280 [compost metagenome]